MAENWNQPRLENTQPPRQSVFVTTHWSLVLSAAGQGQSPQSTDALEKLCRTYWYPLYAYVRRCGDRTKEDAEDSPRRFSRGCWSAMPSPLSRRKKGRFRSFLLASMNHFLADEWDKARAQKRGGGKVIPLDLQSAETGWAKSRWKTSHRRRRLNIAGPSPCSNRFTNDWAGNIARGRQGHAVRRTSHHACRNERRCALRRAGAATRHDRRRGESGRAPVAPALPRAAARRPSPIPCRARTKWRTNCAICSGRWPADESRSGLLSYFPGCLNSRFDFRRIPCNL